MKPPRKPPRKSAPYSEIPVDFDLGEPPTPARNLRVILYQKLVACVDHLSDKRADDLTEIACLFTDATEAKRERLLTVCRWLAE